MDQLDAATAAMQKVYDHEARVLADLAIEIHPVMVDIVDSVWTTDDGSIPIIVMQDLSCGPCIEGQ